MGRRPSLMNAPRKLVDARPCFLGERPRFGRALSSLLGAFMKLAGAPPGFMGEVLRFVHAPLSLAHAPMKLGRDPPHRTCCLSYAARDVA